MEYSTYPLKIKQIAFPQMQFKKQKFAALFK